MSKWVQPYVVVKAAQPSLGARLLRLFGGPPGLGGTTLASMWAASTAHPSSPPARGPPPMPAGRRGARALRPRRRHRTGEVCHCARDRAPAGVGCGLGLGGVVGDDGLSRIQRRMVLLRFALEALGAGDLREQLACAEGAFWASGSSARNWVSVAAAAHSPTANRNRAWCPG